MDDPEYVVDHVATAIKDILLSQVSTPSRLPDLGLIVRFTASHPEYKIVNRLINLRNLCYGVVLTNSDGTNTYLPVRYSAYPIEGAPVLCGPRPEIVLPKSALDTTIIELNRFIGDKKNPEPYDQISPHAHTILDSEGHAVGFIHGHLSYFHDAVIPETTNGAVRFPYDSRLVDAAIIANRTQPARPASLANAARSRNRLYRLFLAEFAAVLRTDRNKELRRHLLSAIKDTKFESPKSVATLRRRLLELLQDYPEDLAAVREAVMRAYVHSPSDPSRAAAAAIESTAFRFDRQTMSRLRALKSHAAVVTAVRALMQDRVVAISSASTAPPNMYVSCTESSDITKEQCVNRQLAVPSDRLDDFYDILAADVQNPGKTGLLSAISAGVFDPLKFITSSRRALECPAGVDTEVEGLSTLPV